MYISPDFIVKLRDHLDISAIVSKKVKLTKKGKEYSGLCPFHNERTPSFTVNDQKQFYHCFGCGAHGDIVKFTMECLRLEFVDAIKLLAEEAKLTIPNDEAKEKTLDKKTTNDLYEIMKVASDWFREQLLVNNYEAKNYLIKRNVSAKVIDKFKIGFAPSGNKLISYLRLQNIPEVDMEKAGLVIKDEGNKYYDRFRNRIIFPISNKFGKVIAFGGRAFGNEQPKYLNSPETLIFKKNEILYNMYDASIAAKESNRIILVEGYMDVISMHTAGFTESVASLGTAINENHIQSLWKINPEPLVCLDGDKAGKHAAKRLSNLVIPILKAGHSLKFVNLPENKDPDDVLKSFGKAYMQRLLDEAIALSDMLWNSEFNQLDEVITPEKKAFIEQKLMHIVDKINDKQVKSNYKSFFLNKIWTNLKRNNINFIKKSKVISDIYIENIDPIIRSENMLFSIILCYPQLFSDYEIEEEFTMLELYNSELEDLRIAMLQTKNSIDDIYLISKDSFKEKLDATLKKLEYYNCNFEYLYNENRVLFIKKNDINYIQSLWICNINRYRINLLTKEKQKILYQLTDESTEKAKMLHNQILLLENLIASTTENML